MIILALLDVDETTACDLACRVAANGVPVRNRLRVATERVLRERPATAQVRWARLARQDREDMERRLSRQRGA
jgi:hypothetical protein